MNCLKNLDRTTLSLDVVSKLLTLYEYRGKEFYYREVLNQEFKTINQKAIEKDAFFLAKIRDLKITENRLHLLIEKDLDAKNKDEELAKNIRKTLENLNKSFPRFEYIPSDITQMTNGLFKDLDKVTYVTTVIRQSGTGFLHETKRVSTEDTLTLLLHLFEQKIEEKNTEKLLTIVSFYIDFINQKNYNKENDFIMLILIYILLAQSGFEVVRYTSFYEKLYNRLVVFKDSILQANYNWDQGYSQLTMLHQTLIETLLDSYKELDKIVDHYLFDSKNRKTDNLENIILKGPEIFSKADLKKKYPLISDSTINRTLERLKENGSIVPMGTGRSAKWRKIIKTEKKLSEMEQTTIFDIEQEYLKK